MDRATARGVVREFDTAASEEPTNLLRSSMAPSDPRLYLRQRVLFETLRRGDRADDLHVEEEVVRLFAAVLRNGYLAAGREPRPISDRADHAAVRRAQSILAARFREPMSLMRLASETGLSMFRLAHVFRQQTLSSLHAWRVKLRLSAAVDALSESRGIDLTELALELGFSSHSHFTASFRKAFGVPPSILRDRIHRVRSGARARGIAASFSRIPIASHHSVRAN
ncbi:MAG: AraC family transcriptional regulator [Thermoanaerobaculia bacterium]